jgi:hypothetical protein
MFSTTLQKNKLLEDILLISTATTTTLYIKLNVYEYTVLKNRMNKFVSKAQLWLFLRRVKGKEWDGRCFFFF